jgi:aspartyl-tRNA(Asn)/glutamyl-tRNA(Gln) amidotransferase subunit A
MVAGMTGAKNILGEPTAELRIDDLTKMTMQEAAD